MAENGKNAFDARIGEDVSGPCLSHCYAALSSVWESSDAELLEAMFAFYPKVDVEPILDATHNSGRFWKGSSRRVVSMDIDPQHKPDILCDNREMPGVESESFGVVVYDPPARRPAGKRQKREAI